MLRVGWVSGGCRVSVVAGICIVYVDGVECMWVRGVWRVYGDVGCCCCERRRVVGVGCHVGWVSGECRVDPGSVPGGRRTCRWHVKVVGVCVRVFVW
jgi:hypothetical protein